MCCRPKDLGFFRTNLHSISKDLHCECCMPQDPSFKAGEFRHPGSMYQATPMQPMQPAVDSSDFLSMLLNSRSGYTQQANEHHGISAMLQPHRESMQPPSLTSGFPDPNHYLLQQPFRPQPYLPVQYSEQQCQGQYEEQPVQQEQACGTEAWQCSAAPQPMQQAAPHDHQLWVHPPPLSMLQPDVQQLHVDQQQRQPDFGVASLTEVQQTLQQNKAESSQLLLQRPPQQSASGFAIKLLLQPFNSSSKQHVSSTGAAVNVCIPISK